MINTKFEAFKLGRALKSNGVDFQFFRAEKNKFEEPTSSSVAVGTVCGLLHVNNEQAGSDEIKVTNNVQVLKKTTPAILCYYDTVNEIGLKIEDTCEINGKTFKVTNIKNIQEWCIIADVVLEVFEDGDNL